MKIIRYLFFISIYGGGGKKSRENDPMQVSDCYNFPKGEKGFDKLSKKTRHCLRKRIFV